LNRHDAIGAKEEDARVPGRETSCPLSLGVDGALAVYLRERSGKAVEISGSSRL